MSSRFVRPNDRLVFLALGTWAIVMAVFMALDDSGARRVWGRPVWAILLGVGGLLTMVFTRQMASFTLRGYAAGAMVVGCVGRGLGMIMAVVNGTAHTAWSGFLGLGAWTMLGFLLYLVWRSRVPDGGDGVWSDG